MLKNNLYIPLCYGTVCRAVDELVSGRLPLILVAIDGRAGSGKTVLSRFLEERYECNVFHMDDFFLRPSQRTPERLNEVGGNVDYERFRSEILKPLIEGRTVEYRAFSCNTWTLGKPSFIPPRRLNIVEGAYSMHPYFGNVWNLRLFMDIDPEEQMRTVMRRNGEEKWRLFRDVWIPKEEAYLSRFGVRESCSAVLKR